MKRFLFPFMVILLACGEPTEQVAEEQNTEIYIPLSTPEDVTIDHIFSEYHYVPLETRDDVLMPDWTVIRDLNLGDDGSIYITDYLKLYAFDSNGKLKYILDKRGQGPDSYLGIYAFMVWENGDISLSQYVRSINTYNNRGDLLSKFTYQTWPIKDLTSINDSLMLVRLGQVQIDSMLFHVVHRRTGEILHSYFPQKKIPNIEYAKHDFLYKYDNKILLNGYQTNTIYELRQDTAVVRYVINVDNRMPPEDYWYQEVKDGRKILHDWENAGYIGHIPYYVENDSLIFLRFEGGAKEYQAYAVVDKATRESRIVRRLIFDEGFAWEPQIVWSIKDGWCVIPIYAHEAITNPKFAAKFPNLKEDDNPILFIGKVK